MARPGCTSDQVISVQSRRWLRIYCWLYRIRPYEALNCELSSSVLPSQLPQAALAAKLKQAINRIKAAGVDLDTGRVYYQVLAHSDAYHVYRDTLYMLRDFDPFSITEHAAQMAFWINFYNALIIHTVIAYGVKKKITEIPGVFERTAYIVGGYRLKRQ